MKARVHVTLKNGVLDPQGKAIGHSLNRLGFAEVGDVRQGKFFEMDLQVSGAADAERLAAEVADRVLTNPVIESYRIELTDAGTDGGHR